MKLPKISFRKVNEQLTEVKKISVQEVHEAFDSAQDRLLEQALSIIKASESSLSKGDAVSELSRLGFVKSKTVVDYEREKKSHEMSTQQANLIQYYKQTYPYLKFITEEELVAICNKYNLIFAEVKHFTGEVPESNIKDMINAQVLKLEDKPGTTVFIRIDRTYEHLNEDHKPINGKVFDISKYVTINDRGEVEFDKYYTLHEVLRHFLLSEGITKERLNPVAEYSIFERNSAGLYICAPEDQFDTTNLVDVNGLLKLGRPILVEKDPIVFRYVRGGVQIITKWGLEAADEALANEKLN